MTTDFHTAYIDGTTEFKADHMNAPLVELDTQIGKNATRSICIVPFESDVDVETGDGKVAFTVPALMNGFLLTAALASVHTQGVTGTCDVQIRRRRSGSDADMLTTKITIGAEYYAADGAINTANDDLDTGDQIFIDVDAVHSGTAPKGLSVTMTFTDPNVS
jgi:hypothetical protein